MYGDGFTFAATFKDPDGAGTDAQVVAQLRFVGPNGIRIIKTLDSNKSARPTNDVQRMHAPLNYSDLNDDEGYYVVRLYVYRKDTTLGPAAYGYNLCSAIF